MRARRPRPGACWGERLTPMRTRPPRARQPASTSMHTRSGRSPADGRVDQLELLDAVDHQGDARSPLQARERSQGSGVGGRVGDQELLGAVRGEPQSLGQRERERTLEAASREHPFLQGAAAQRLAREANRLRRGAAFEVLRVRPHRVEVDERERRLEPGRRALEARVGVVSHRSHPARSARRASRSRGGRTEHSIGPRIGEASARDRAGARTAWKRSQLGIARTERGRGLEVALAPVRASVESVHDRLDGTEVGLPVHPAGTCARRRSRSRARRRC